MFCSISHAELFTCRQATPKRAIHTAAATGSRKHFALQMRSAFAFLAALMAALALWTAGDEA